MDTLRQDYLGCYGFEGPVSPNLDRIAAESFLFRRCYAAAPRAKPSIASIFTSLPPAAHGVTNHKGNMWGDGAPDLMKGVLRDEARTLAEALKERGYTTAAFVANPWLTWEYGFDQGFDVYSSVVDPPADRVTFEGERWLASMEGRRPFFLYLHFMDVHDPYNAPEPDYEALRESPGVATEVVFSEPEWDRAAGAHKNSRWTFDGAGEKMPETRPLQTFRARYAAGVRDLDRRVGPFLDRLREQGILDDAYLVITADHGEELYDHGNWGHGYTLYEDQIRVPLLIRPPGGLAEGKEIEQLVGLIDLYPTLVGLSGPPPGDVTGSDLIPLLRGTGEGGTQVIFSTATRNNPQLWSLTVGSFKLIVNGATSRVAMFNILEDPVETRNLGGERPEQLRVMRENLDRILAAEQGRGLFEPPTRPISEQQTEILRSLGYLD